MAFYQFLCASTVMIILLSGGCHSLQPVCGRAAKNTSSVGGRDAPPESWPWLVSFNSNGRHFCSGSLINNQWVLTSVYCAFRPYNNTKVYLGRFNQSGPNFNGVSRGLERTVCDPSYNLCLLKLSAPVNFTDYIQPVCLASAGSTFHTGVSSWFAGFGDTQADSSSGADILQEVKLSIVGKKECKCAHPYISDYGICAVTRKGGKDSCQGFSGEPLVTKEGFVWIQSGIVNYGCGRPGYPGVYIRVSQHQDWITNIINNSSEPGFVTYRSSGVDSDLNVTCSTIQPTTATITITPNTTSPWPPINPNLCGRAAKNTSSVGGRDAPPESWPWLVSLNSDGRHFCSGSLINNQWVLTSVYCAYGHNDTKVYLGRFNQSGPNFNGVSRGLERTVCDPSYYICLLKLSAPVNFTDYIQPVCLASAGSTFHTGVSSWVAGFDSPSGADILQEVKVSIVGNKECKCAHPYIRDNLICAVTRKGGNDTCQGFSGEPLVTKEGFVWIQSGIVTYGCGRPGYPGVYIRVSLHQDWITNITNNSSEPGFVTYRSSGVDSDLNVTCSITPNTTSPWPPINPNCDSLFCNGGNVVHFSHFSSLCLLVISLCVLV